LIVWT
jgi:hypothetical protein